VTSSTDADDFSESLGCLIADAMVDLAARLAGVAGLTCAERGVVADATRASLTEALHGRLGRVLLLELHAAVEDGLLVAADSAGRWHEFIERSSSPAFWEELTTHYPTLMDRVNRLVEQRCASALTFATHFATDREALDEFHGSPLGELVALAIGAGDSHRGGRTVALLTCARGPIVYKPRSVGIDAALSRFIEPLTAQGASLRVPPVVERDGYGWAAFVEHRYAADDGELTRFYRGLGEWLAVMRLLGGSDLHAENLIAHGAHPFVIDCETLFTPHPPVTPSGMGLAHDRAVGMVEGSVLSMGFLPGRGAALAWRGVDSSGMGALPGQQPSVEVPAIVDAGTDRARLGTVMVEPGGAANHPSRAPALAAHWPKVVEGFDQVTAWLRSEDAAGRLADRLRSFAGCEVRAVVRSTEVYAELARMLWHPVSLHAPDEAMHRAAALLRRMGLNRAISPDRDDVIAAEIADLLDGDIPLFSTVVSEGRLAGPRGTSWLDPRDLAEDALRRWREADLALERQAIRASLASAYADGDRDEAHASLRPVRLALHDLDRRRRRLAAGVMKDIVRRAIRGDDGSVAWIASVLGPNGRSVQPIAQDVYGGIAGIALLAHGYTRERDAGRADDVSEIDAIAAAAVDTMRWAEAQLWERRTHVARPRPVPPGGYIGLGSQIASWLLLEAWGATAAGEGVERAQRLAGLIAESVAADDTRDLLTGSSGAIAPLLTLYARTKDASHLTQAMTVGDALIEAARRQDGRAWWPHERWPDGLGGFAHGSTGIGWALAKLAQASGQDRFLAISRAALAFDASLFDPATGWRDLRGGDPAAAWCHGAVGIGLALVDLDPALDNADRRAQFRVASTLAWQNGIGGGHGLCHGDMGAWELLDIAVRTGFAPAGCDSDTLETTIIGSIESHGARCGRQSEDLSPGLIAGLGGVAWQLLRMHPESALPSVLLPSFANQTSTRSAHSDNVPSPPPMTVAASTSLG